MEEEVNEENNGPEKDTHVFLDFNGKVQCDIFEGQVFMRIANLQEKNPLVQVNDSVFKGTYDYSIGTNLFFEEVEDAQPSADVFEKQAPIQLKHTLSEMKVLSLKPVKIPQRKVTIPNEVTKLDFNLNWDYKKLLEKFENGSLHIEDIVTKECQNQMIANEEVSEDQFYEEPSEDPDENQKVLLEHNEQTNDKEKEDEENTLQNIVPVKILVSEYEKLNVLARRPVKRAVSPELVAECDNKYVEAFEYHNIERQILHPSDAFRTEIVTEVNEATLSDCVDIDRCVLYGLIPPSSQFPRVLSKREKERLLRLENFDNLSLAARYYVLRNHVHDLEDYIATVPKNTLQEKDEFGRTPNETLQIYRKLCKAVMNRIQEIKSSYSEV